MSSHDRYIVTHIDGEPVESLIEASEMDRFNRMQDDINNILWTMGHNAVSRFPGRNTHNLSTTANIPLMDVRNRLITHIRSHDNTRWESVDEILELADSATIQRTVNTGFVPIQQTENTDSAMIRQSHAEVEPTLTYDESVRRFQEIVHRVNLRAERHSCRVRSVLDEWDRLMNGTRRRPSIARRALPWVLAAVCGSGVLYAFLCMSFGVL